MHIWLILRFKNDISIIRKYNVCIIVKENIKIWDKNDFELKITKKNTLMDKYLKAKTILY